GYYINSFLPSGLNFNSTTGVISGTPAVTSPATIYTVTGYNITGSSTATVNITVNPLTLSYNSPQVYTAGTAITALSPVINGTVAGQAYNSTAVPFAGGFSSLTGVVTDAAGNIYVSDLGATAVYKIPANGGSAVSIGTGFSSPFGLAVDKA